MTKNPIFGQKYENGNDQIRHWNDGWAQVHRWEINGEKGTVVHLKTHRIKEKRKTQW